MLPSSLVRECFCKDSAEASATVKPFLYWVQYHFGGRPDEEVEFILAAVVQSTGLLLGEEQSYSDFFAQFSVDDLYSLWQEALAHA